MAPNEGLHTSDAIVGLRKHALLAERGGQREDAPVDRPVTHYATTEDDVNDLRELCFE